MYGLANILQCTEDKNGTYLKIFLPNVQLGDILRRKHIKNAEMRFDDGRHISAEQRKKHMQPFVILQIIPDISPNNKRNG